MKTFCFDLVQFLNAKENNQSLALIKYDCVRGWNFVRRFFRIHIQAVNKMTAEIKYIAALAWSTLENKTLSRTSTGQSEPGATAAMTLCNMETPYSDSTCTYKNTTKRYRLCRALVVGWKDLRFEIWIKWLCWARAWKSSLTLGLSRVVWALGQPRL